MSERMCFGQPIDRGFRPQMPSLHRRMTHGRTQNNNRVRQVFYSCLLIRSVGCVPLCRLLGLVVCSSASFVAALVLQASVPNSLVVSVHYLGRLGKIYVVLPGPSLGASIFGEMA